MFCVDSIRWTARHGQAYRCLACRVHTARGKPPDLRKALWVSGEIRRTAQQDFFSIEDVDQLFVTYNPDLLELIAPQLEAELAQELAATSFKEQLKGVLKRYLAGRKPRLEDAAREMR